MKNWKNNQYKKKSCKFFQEKVSISLALKIIHKNEIDKNTKIIFNVFGK